MTAVEQRKMLLPSPYFDILQEKSRFMTGNVFSDYSRSSSSEGK
jgi:hypothetical protein